MPKQKLNLETQTEGTAPAPKRTRTVKPKSPMVLEVESRLKEARSLDKVLVVVPKLSAWGCAQVVKALQANKHYVTVTLPTDIDTATGTADDQQH